MGPRVLLASLLGLPYFLWPRFGCANLHWWYAFLRGAVSLCVVCSLQIPVESRQDSPDRPSALSFLESLSDVLVLLDDRPVDRFLRRQLLPWYAEIDRTSCVMSVLTVRCSCAQLQRHAQLRQRYS